jgi:hypothetical protein
MSDEVTPVDGRTPYEWILAEVIKTRKASETAANAALETSGDVKTMLVRHEALERRVTRLEAANVWFPTVVSLVALTTAILALVR